MTNRVITTAQRVADVLEQVPGATELFRAHGFDPRVACGALTHHLHLRDAGRECGLADIEGLVEELRAAHD